jgi:hypothetical protein
MVDTLDLKSNGPQKSVPVRVRPAVLKNEAYDNH